MRDATSVVAGSSPGPMLKSGVDKELLARHGLDAPDGRPLFSYGCDDAARARLAHDLKIRLLAGSRHQITAARFVLWAAEEIRTAHQPGRLRWEWLFGRLRRPSDQDLGRDLVERGLAWWRRPVRRSESEARHHQYLYSLMAEGGLPESYLAGAALYRDTMLAMLADIEAEGAVADLAVERIAWRRASSLPQTFRHDDTVLLFASLTLALAQLRARLPADLPAQAAEAWLDGQDPGWRAELPLRFSQGALEALIRPALLADRGETARPVGLLCRRELRRCAEGTNWAAYAVVSNGALLPAEFLPGASPGLRLRLLVLSGDDGPAPGFLGVPERGGWRLARTGAASEIALRLDPEKPLVLAAYADGRPVGEAVADAGLPLPAVAPGFWRAIDSRDSLPDRLEPLGLARTRACALWLLAPTEASPVAGDGVTLGEPEPAPSGRLWRVSGRGTITLSGQSLSVETGAGSEAQAHRLHLLGRYMPGWRCEDGQIPFRGKPDVWGAEDEHSLRRLGAGVAMQPIPRRLGGQLALWRHEGAVVARAMFFALPEDAHINVREVQAGEVQLRATGLVAGWHVRLQAAEVTQAAAVSPGGDVGFALSIAGEAPASLQLRLSNPAAGSDLVLVAPWPARRGMIVTPKGRRLARDCAMAVGGLTGWRGVTPPERGGALLLRAGGTEVGVPIVGEVRLAGAEPLVRLMLALGGLDAEARLNLVVDGTESPRLLLRRYDTSAKLEKGVFVAEGEAWRLHAVPLAPRGEARQLDGVSGCFDVAGWLADTAALWLIQARAASGGAARPAIWSADPPPFSTRDARIAGYAEEWRRLLTAPSDPEWMERWQVIRAVRDGGDAGALDQVQALGATPAAAVALLLQVAESDLASVLALCGEAPIWWPVLPVADWASGVATAEARNRTALHSVGFEAGQAAAMTEEIMQRRAGAVLALRPELQGHLGAAFVANRIPPVALASHAPGGLLPLATPNADQRFRELLQQAARRETQPPENTAGLPSARRSHAAGLPDHLRALLDAPLVTAEIATGLMPPPDKTTLIRLLALRQADPVWFDAVLPVSVQLCLEDART